MSDDPTVREVADTVEEDGLEDVVSIHRGHNKPYIDADLVEVLYGVSGRKAKKTVKLLRKRMDAERLAEEVDVDGP